MRFFQLFLAEFVKTNARFVEKSAAIVFRSAALRKRSSPHLNLKASNDLRKRSFPFYFEHPRLS